MIIRKELGRTGVAIPEIGMGTWDYHGGAAALRRGMDAGALFIDTPESYGSEQVAGEAVRGMREHVFIATKVSPEHFRAGDLCRSAEGSLRRMRLEAVDLLELHLNWRLSREGVVAVPKSDSAARIVENRAASGWRLSAEQQTLLGRSIRYRRGNRVDALLRRCLPMPVQHFALCAPQLLPASVRRRFT